jgi:CDP-2,3-bis-(O-geranylgeranyl)-sn-glycerol synthase
MSIVVDALYFFIPAYVANTFACIFGHGRPVDLGKTFIDGKRILGDGVTIRGSLAGITCGTLSGVLMAPYSHPFLPNATSTDIILLAFLLSFGAIIGDAVGSFIKRRIGLERGAPAPLLDQLNFVFGGLIFSAFIVAVPLRAVVVLLLLTPFGHLMVNKTGYLLKMKDVPW